MKQGDDDGEQNGPGSEAEAGEGLAETLFTGEAFGGAAVMGAGKVWVVHGLCLVWGESIRRRHKGQILDWRFPRYAWRGMSRWHRGRHP